MIFDENLLLVSVNAKYNKWPVVLTQAIDRSFYQSLKKTKWKSDKLWNTPQTFNNHDVFKNWNVLFSPAFSSFVSYSDLNSVGATKNTCVNVLNGSVFYLENKSFSFLHHSMFSYLHDLLVKAFLLKLYLLISMKSSLVLTVVTCKSDFYELFNYW